MVFLGKAYEMKHAKLWRQKSNKPLVEIELLTEDGLTTCADDNPQLSDATTNMNDSNT